MIKGKHIFLVILLGFFCLVGVAQKYKIVSGGLGWKSTSKYTPGWKDPNFDDSAWGIPVSPSPNPGANPVPGTASMWVTPYSDSAYFRFSFELKSTCYKSEWQGVKGSKVSVDDYYELYVNGTQVGSGLRFNPWTDIINPFLQVGKNVIAIRASNNNGPYAIYYGVDISYLSGPEIELDPDKFICEGDSAFFGPKDNYQSYKWSNGQTTRSLKAKIAGKYWLTAKDTALCDWVDTVELFTYKHTDVEIGKNQTICTGEIAKFDAGPSYSSYEWFSYDENKRIWAPLGDITQSIQVNYSAKFFVGVTDANGCYSSDSVNVRTFDNASVTLGKDTILCKGDSMVLSASWPLSVYKWDDGNTGTFRLVTGPGVYAVTVTNFCGSVSDNINIDYINTISVDLGLDEFFCFEQKYEIKPEVFGAANFLWSTGDTTFKILVNEPGYYSVKVEDLCGNKDEDEIELIRPLKTEYHVPNSFSPNHDGINETWKPIIETYGDYSLKIIDRWGRIVFETTDTQGEWDGLYKGSEAAQGKFVYRVRFVDCEFQTEIFTGRLNLLR